MSTPTAKLTPELQAVFTTQKARMDALTLEVMRDVWHRMPFGQEIALSNGETATIRPFVEPREGNPEREDDLSRPNFGFDVVGPGGSWHLEFWTSRGGWGGAV